MTTIELLFEFYKNTKPPWSSKSMEAIILLCSARRSLFPTDKDRSALLGRVMTGIQEVLSKQVGFEHQDNYHQLCRLVGRPKSNYQLSELVKAEGHLEWLDLASQFTVQSTRNWQYCTNSIHYLLVLGLVLSRITEGARKFDKTFVSGQPLPSSFQLFYFVVFIRYFSYLVPLIIFFLQFQFEYMKKRREREKILNL